MVNHQGPLKTLIDFTIVTLHESPAGMSTKTLTSQWPEAATITKSPFHAWSFISTNLGRWQQSPIITINPKSQRPPSATNCNLLICNALDHSQSHTNVITKLESELEWFLELYVCHNISQGCQESQMAHQATIYRANHLTSHWDQTKQKSCTLDFLMVASDQSSAFLEPI